MCKLSYKSYFKNKKVRSGLSIGQVCAQFTTDSIRSSGEISYPQPTCKTIGLAIQVNIGQQLVLGKVENRQKSTKSLQIQQDLTTSIQDLKRPNQIWQKSHRMWRNFCEIMRRTHWIWCISARSSWKSCQIQLEKLLESLKIAKLGVFSMELCFTSFGV